MGNWDDAERQLLAVKAPVLRAEAAHAATVLRCLVHNGAAESGISACSPRILATTHHDRFATGKALEAWRYCQQAELARHLPLLLAVLADDCYAQESYLVAARAFRALERVAPSAQAVTGLRGSVAGVVRGVLLGNESVSALR